jgi:hypothetical protein
VEVDGNLLPPNIVNKLNIFMVNVLRFRGSGDLSGLVDKAGSRNRRFTATGAVADGNGGRIAGGKIASDNPAGGTSTGNKTAAGEFSGCAACEADVSFERFEREREKAAAGK